MGEIRRFAKASRQGTLLDFIPNKPAQKSGHGTPLTAKEKAIHNKGLISILQQIHHELDAAVLDAYGWQDLSAEGTPCSGGPANETPLESAAAPADKGLIHSHPMRRTARRSVPTG